MSKPLPAGVQNFFTSYEIERLEVLPLLFQTGYLTIKDYDPQRNVYTLGYPNYEVENSFTSWLLSAFSESEQTLVGVNFDSATRSIGGWQEELLLP